jgi:alkylation response protein AidB-like acyl-CoA dehydrogenase
MDFSLSEAQAEIAGLARKILAGPDSAPRQWTDLAAAGVLAAGLPEALGGAGLGFLEQCSVLAEAGRAASPVPYLSSLVLGAGAIAAFGSPEQQRRWAAPAGDGSVVLTAALAEEDSDDPASPSTWAERTGSPGSGTGGWRLSGVKTAVPALPRADLVLVPATVTAGQAGGAGQADEEERAGGTGRARGTGRAGGIDGGERAGEVVVFLVEPSDHGVGIAPQELTDSGPGADGPDAGRLVLDGVRVDDSRVLGAPGRRGDVAGWLAARGTVGLCAVQAGVVGRALELTAQYARQREQFGRPIGSFQAVAQRLADAYTDVEAVWLTMWQAAWLLATRSHDDAEVAAAIATAKFWAADAGHRVAHTAVHVHGGTGIDTSYVLHNYFTAAKRAEFTLGGATEQLRRLGDLIASASWPLARRRGGREG